jgi:hypothetical protein
MMNHSVLLDGPVQAPFMNENNKDSDDPVYKVIKKQNEGIVRTLMLVSE